MAEQLRKSWLRGRVEDGLRRGFQHVYEKVKVDLSTPKAKILEIDIAADLYAAAELHAQAPD